MNEILFPCLQRVRKPYQTYGGAHKTGRKDFTANFSFSPHPSCRLSPGCDSDPARKNASVTVTPGKVPCPRSPGGSEGVMLRLLARNTPVPCWSPSRGAPSLAARRVLSPRSQTWGFPPQKWHWPLFSVGSFKNSPYNFSPVSKLTIRVFNLFQDIHI